VVVGAGLLVLAVCVFLAALPSDGWGPSGARFGLMLSAFPGLPGACVLLLGVYLVRQTNAQRDFNEAMEWNNRWLRGTASDGTGSPIPKAIVDVFWRGWRWRFRRGWGRSGFWTRCSSWRRRARSLRWG
jgi:hypothetical protein